MNSNRGRVLVAKPVTHSNSARVNFMNRKKDGDSFAKTLARAWVSRVGPLSREQAIAWAILARTRGSLWWAEPRCELGRAVNSFSNFPAIYKCLFNIVSS